MDKDELVTKQQNLKAQFDSLTQEKAQLVTRTEEIDAELFRMQGDFRTLDNLIKDWNTDEANNDPAKTIKVKAKK